jgi:hypothetical protein
LAFRATSIKTTALRWVHCDTVLITASVFLAPASLVRIKDFWVIIAVITNSVTVSLFRIRDIWAIITLVSYFIAINLIGIGRLWAIITRASCSSATTQRISLEQVYLEVTDKDGIYYSDITNLEDFIDVSSEPRKV